MKFDKLIKNSICAVMLLMFGLIAVFYFPNFHVVGAAANMDDNRAATDSSPSYTFSTINKPAASAINFGPSGINNSGQIVGNYTDNNAGRHGFLYSNGAFSTIDYPGTTGVTFAYGINASGQIVGAYFNNAGGHGMLYKDGNFSTFDIAGAPNTYLQGINAVGQIAGWNNVVIDSANQTSRGFLKNGGTITTLAYPGAYATQALGLNDAGQVVGFYTDNNGGKHGFLYSNGSFSTIDYPGAPNTFAYGINASGQIIGYYAGSVHYNGFLYSNGTFSTINDPFGGNTFLYGINDAGQIVGVSDERAFVATPTSGNTSTGSNVTVTLENASVTFPNVSQSGTTTATSINPASAGTPPAGYTVCSSCSAYDITTTAAYTPPVTVCLAVPASLSQQNFATLALLHGENGALVDRTSSRFTDANGVKYVCGSVSSLSPFVLAQSSSTVNSIDDPTYFVSQHYRDFLNRAPDQAGLAFWTNQITSCNGDANCIDIKRQNVSAAYFLSREFQETGFFVIKVQRVAFGKVSNDAAKRVTYQQFLKDAQAVGQGFVDGQTGADQILEQNKTAYAQSIVSSSDFTTKYPTSLSASAYVDALFSTAGVKPQGTERQDAIAAFGSGDTAGRAAALRKIAESNSVKQAEFNSAFVLLQYFGYLRRNPTDLPDTSDAGYQFWLGNLNQFNGDYIASQMVRSFIVSQEYRKRFGAQ